MEWKNSQSWSNVKVQFQPRTGSGSSHPLRNLCLWRDVKLRRTKRPCWTQAVEGSGTALPEFFLVRSGWSWLQLVPKRLPSCVHFCRHFLVSGKNLEMQFKHPGAGQSHWCACCSQRGLFCFGWSAPRLHLLLLSGGYRAVPLRCSSQSFPNIKSRSQGCV